jgi:hypothetical protein
MVLNGKEEEIELAFNGLFNLCATSGQLRYTDHTRTCATFWSKEKSMKRFFFNSDYLKHDSKPHANAHADAMMLELTSQSIQFFDFSKEAQNDGFNMGTNKAERPDLDFKDSVINHSFLDKTSTKDVEKMLDK